VHGTEYTSIAAVREWARSLDPAQVRGRITAVPLVNPTAFAARSPFVVPEDGKNLNRSFPGSAHGTYTDVLAHSIFEELIAPADALIDLHGGDMVEALEPFAIYEASPVEKAADALAVAFGLPYVVREEPKPGGLGGMTSSAAATAGIPAIIAEAGGCGQLENDAVQQLADGVRNALRQLGMLPGPPAPPPMPQRRVGRFDWLTSRDAGWWAPAVRAGEQVAPGALLGRVHDLWGDVIEEIHSPADGVVLFLTTSPAVKHDGLLLGLGAELEPVVR
jgi:predicted deacylase